VILDNFKPASCTDLFIVRAGVNPDFRFIAYYLNSATGVAHVGVHTVGAVQQHFSLGNARDALIVLPPLGGQRAIAGALALDNEFELNRRMNETLEEIARAPLKSWFVDFDPAPAKADGHQTWGTDAEAALHFPNEFEASELGAIPKGRQVGRPDEIANMTMAQPPSGNTLLSVLAPFRELNMARERGATGWGAAAIRPDAPFRGYLSCSRRLSQAGWRSQRWEGTLCRFASKAVVTAFPITVPSPELAEVFGRVIDLIDGKVVNGTLESETLAELRDTLLSKLISGGVRVRDAARAV